MKRDLVLVGVVAIFVALFWWAYQIPKAATTPAMMQARLEARYGSSTYVVSQASGARDETAAFTPALANDETVVLGALHDVARRVYEDTSITDAQPSVETIDGENYITFSAAGNKTFFQLFKDEHGRVGSVRFWRQPSAK